MTAWRTITTTTAASIKAHLYECLRLTREATLGDFDGLLFFSGQRLSGEKRALVFVVRFFVFMTVVVVIFAVKAGHASL